MYAVIINFKHTVNAQARKNAVYAVPTEQVVGICCISVYNLDSTNDLRFLFS